MEDIILKSINMKLKKKGRKNPITFLKIYKRKAIKITGFNGENNTCVVTYKESFNWFNPLTYIVGIFFIFYIMVVALKEELPSFKASEITEYTRVDYEQ